jgi:methylaspartate mutase epsilon subunit
MGFADPRKMRDGLWRTKLAAATTVGTLTLDSYTRLGDHEAAATALATGAELNGYPIVTHRAATTRSILDGIYDDTFPVQVRHGSADPREIIASLIACGLNTTEGGPISYCLPYGRTPLSVAADNWARGCEALASAHTAGAVAHVETFGGCILGQLCPPSMLVAVSVLEAMFFVENGIDSISLSYSQQVDPGQDEEAIHALGRLAGEFLGEVDWHIVVYTYMGVFPRTRAGSERLLEQATRLAVRSGASRLIVKTVAEAHRIPTIEENVAALELAADFADSVGPGEQPPAGAVGGIYAEARALIDGALDLGRPLVRALPLAFARGYLDIPYCLHPDNPGRAQSYIDDGGRLQWSVIGSLPLPPPKRRPHGGVTAAELSRALSHVARTFDHGAALTR